MKYAVTITHQGQSITVVVDASCQIKARQHARQALARAEITSVEIAPPDLATKCIQQMQVTEATAHSGKIGKMG